MVLCRTFQYQVRNLCLHHGSWKTHSGTSCRARYEWRAQEFVQNKDIRFTSTCRQTKIVLVVSFCAMAFTYEEQGSQQLRLSARLTLSAVNADFTSCSSGNALRVLSCAHVWRSQDDSPFLSFEVCCQPLRIFPVNKKKQIVAVLGLSPISVLYLKHQPEKWNVARGCQESKSPNKSVHNNSELRSGGFVWLFHWLGDTSAFPVETETSQELFIMRDKLHWDQESFRGPQTIRLKEARNFVELWGTKQFCGTVPSRARGRAKQESRGENLSTTSSGAQQQGQRNKLRMNSWTTCCMDTTCLRQIPSWDSK